MVAIQTRQVQKRSGKLEKLDISKIKKHIEWAVIGLEVNALDLELLINTNLVDNVKTTDIQQNLIINALSLCSMEYPDWRYVAGRLFISNYRKQIHLDRPGSDKDGYLNASVWLQKIEAKTLKDLTSYYTPGEMQELYDYMRPERDLDYDFAGVQMLSTRYLHPNELPQEAFMYTAMVLMSVEPDHLRMGYVKKLYDAISLRKISLATPMLSNSRSPGGSLSSCFITAMADSIDSIFDTVKQVAKISQKGGGAGVTVSHVRAKGSEVNGNPNASGGVVPWIKIINDTAIAVDQNGKRAGAVTIALDSWHLDIEEFLEIQTEAGDLRRKAHDIFPQIVVSDLFMQRVADDASWTLVCPYEFKKYYGVDICSLWGDEFFKYYTNMEFSIGYPGRTKRIKARDLFKKIMKVQIETGLPYIFFKDTVNKFNPNKHEGYIPSANLCVAPETKVLTGEGHKTIKDLVGGFTRVWNGFNWSNVQVKQTGKNVELMKVRFSNGESLDCTLYHKFHIAKGYKGKVEIVEAKNLKPGDKIIKCHYPLIKGRIGKILHNAYTNGIFTAEGTQYSDFKELSLYGAKKELVGSVAARGKNNNPDNPPAIYDDVNSDRLVVKLDNDLKEKFFVPDASYYYKSRLDWFAGLCDGDGYISNNNGNQSLQLGSVNFDFLINVKRMLQTLGVDSKISLNREAGEYPLPDGKGGLKSYDCQTVYRLIVCGGELQKLMHAGCNFKRLKVTAYEAQREAKRFVSVTETEFTGRIDDTYCFNEPTRHLGIFNGIVTGQCVESYSNVNTTDETHCCNLISLNLAEINSEREVGMYSRLAVHTLDNAIEITKPPIDSAENHNNLYRTIGLGTMGLADWLAKRDLQYGAGSIKEVNHLYSVIAFAATLESIELAKERGEYPAFNGSEWDNELFLGGRTIEELQEKAPDLNWKNLQSALRIYGIRNSHLLAIAPNTSSSLIQGCTASILPTYSKFFYDTWGSGNVPIMPKFIKEKMWWYQENKHTNQRDVIDTVSAIQFWIDTGISMELMFNLNPGVYAPDYTLNAQEIYKTLIYAWKKGCKAIYYVRSVQKDTITEQSECSVCAN